MSNQQHHQQLYNQQANQGFNPAPSQPMTSYHQQPQAQQPAPMQVQQQGQPFLQQPGPLYAQQPAQSYVQQPAQAYNQQTAQKYAQQPAQSYAQQSAQVYAQQPLQPLTPHNHVQHPYGQPTNRGTGQAQQSTSTTTVETEVVTYRKAQRQAKRQAEQPVPYTPAPQPAASALDYNSLKVAPPPVKEMPRSSSTNITTEAVSRTEIGGRSRQAAAAKGDAELQRFDQRVTQMLKEASSICMMGYPYFKAKGGYLCGGGNHFVLDSEVEAMLMGRRPFGPRIEFSNDIEDPPTWVAPPKDGWDQPFHLDPIQREMHYMAPLPLKHDGTRHDISRWLAMIQAERSMILMGPMAGMMGFGSPFGP